MSTPANDLVATRAPLPPGTPAHGLVVQISLEHTQASAIGTSLERIARAIQQQVSALLPIAEVSAFLIVDRMPGHPIQVASPKAPGRPAGGRGTSLLKQTVSTSLDRSLLDETPVVIDLDRQHVHIDQALAPLSPKEFAVLRLLVAAPGSTYTRAELMSVVWPERHDDEGAESVSGERLVDATVRRLRRRLGAHGTAIRTVRGKGYRFDHHPDVQVIGPTPATPAGPHRKNGPFGAVTLANHPDDIGIDATPVVRPW